MLQILSNKQNKCEIFIIIPFEETMFHLAHLVEHLMVMNVKAFLNNVMELGGVLVASTYIDKITFSLSCDSQWAEIALRNILSLFRFFRVSDKDVKKEMRIINEERILKLKRANFLSDLNSRIVERFYTFNQNESMSFNSNDVMAFYEKHMYNKIFILNIPTSLAPKCRSLCKDTIMTSFNHIHTNKGMHILKRNAYFLNYTREYYIGVKLFSHGHKFKPFVDLLIYALFSNYDSMMMRYLRFANGLTYSINTTYSTGGVLTIGFSSQFTKNKSIPRLFFKFLTAFTKTNHDTDWQKYVHGFCRHVYYLHHNNPKNQTTFYGLNKFYNSSYGSSYTEYISYIKQHDSLNICKHIMLSILNSPKVMTFRCPAYM